MTCAQCDGPTIVFDVPDDLRAYAPDSTDRATICTRCLSVGTASETDGDTGSFDAIATWFPHDDGGVALALLFGSLDSLALNRRAIEALCDRVERAGADPLLALDRLVDDDELAPHFDVRRRRTQLLQLLE